MRGHSVSLGLALAVGVTVTATVSAEGRGTRPGAVTVRPVQVREVRVNQPAPSRPEDRRPTFGVERRVDHDSISRPVTRPQRSVTSPHRPERDAHRRWGRNRSHDRKGGGNFGYGVVIGYPVLYPYAFPHDPFSPVPGTTYHSPPPAPNTYSNVDSLPSRGNIVAAPPVPAAIGCEASAPCGGVSFDITPAIAQIFVDGVFAGTVDEFDANAPLLLAPGDYYVEIRLAGYRTSSFDVTIGPGEITAHQGSLERLRLRTP